MWSALAPPRAWSTSTKPPEFDTLAAFLDTLIPADETPSASQLGVTDKIIATGKKSRRYRKLIEKGCAWLDRQARQLGAAHFSALTETQRERIAQQAENGEGGLVPAFFFEHIKVEAFSHYYADPRIWANLGYAGPPQPLGFMNYTQPPHE